MLKITWWKIIIRIKQIIILIDIIRNTIMLIRNRIN